MSLHHFNPHFDDFLVEWDEMRKKHYNGEISDEELEEQRDRKSVV